MRFKHTSVAVLLILTVLVGGMTAVAVAEDDPPGAPASFYGEITDDDGVGAPVDTEVFGVAVDSDGEVVDQASITVEEIGEYGGPDALDDKLRVDTSDAEEIEFYVDDPETGAQADDVFDVAAEGDGTYEFDLTFSDAQFDIETITLELDDTVLEPGDTTDATVTAEREDGETDDVTDQTTITSSDEDVASVDDATITAEDLGDATITAELRDQSDSVDVSVVDDAEDDGVEPGNGNGGQPGAPAADNGGIAVDAPDIDDDLGDDAEVTDEDERIIEVDPETGESSVTMSPDSNVESISFTETDVEGTVNVRNIDGTPAATGDPPGDTATLSFITVPEQVQDSSATVNMRVSADRLDEIDASAEQLAVQRFSDGEWSNLDTEVVSESDDEVIVQAETPGFSYFAVSSVDDPVEDDDVDDVEDEEEVDDGIGTTGLIGLVVAIALVIAAAVAYRQMNSGGDGNNL